MKKGMFPALFFALFALTIPHVGMGLDKLEKADLYFEATLFEQAEALYIEVLQDLSEGNPQVIHLKRQLARSYFINRQYAKVASLLNDFELNSQLNQHNDSYLESIFLLGVSLNKLHEYDRSSKVLQNFLKQKSRPQEIFSNEAWFELGIAFFQQKKFEQAKLAFQKVHSNTNQTVHYTLSQLYLARISIIEENEAAVQQAMHNLQDQSLDFVPFAVSFLHGELLYHQQSWKNAAMEFEKAIPTKKQESFQCHEDTLYYLGWCYLNLGKEEDQPLYLKKAATFFKELNAVKSTDKSKLSLGQTLLALHLKASNEEILEELKNLLNPQQQWESRENRHHALLILAEAAPTYSEKKHFFRQLVHESYTSSKYYPKAWYIKGLIELEEGERLNAISETNKESRKYFEQAISSLSKSFDYLYPKEPKAAALALKQQVYAHYYQQTREGLLKSLSIVSRLLNQYRNDLFPQLDNPDEIYFLQGLISSQLLDSAEHETFFTIAENSLMHCIESYPKGLYLQRSLHLLGTLYLQEGSYERAEQTFLELAKQPPLNFFAGEAWYWASEAASHSDTNVKKVQQYRKRVFELTPDSVYADAAFFRYFSYRDYLSGKEAAMEHLNELEERFPYSPYQMNAQYLLGIDALNEKKQSNGKVARSQEPEKAIAHFEQAVKLYDLLPIPDSKKEYFTLVRYRSLIEQANSYLRLEKPENAITILLSVYQEFQTPDHPISSLVRESEQKEKIEEESANLLVQCYLDQNQDGDAGNILSEILERYHLTKTTRGYFLSRAWYQRGVLAMRKKDHIFANQCFRHAEDAAKGKVLSTDELLDLWIQQSISYEKQEKMDEAMLILSKVINYDAVSSERLRAMYLRAEIYENQGRKDLARRQLQATASKGGPWSIKAKEKLEKYHGYQ